MLIPITVNPGAHLGEGIIQLAADFGGVAVVGVAVVGVAGEDKKIAPGGIFQQIRLQQIVQRICIFFAIY